MRTLQNVCKTIGFGRSAHFKRSILWRVWLAMYQFKDPGGQMEASGTDENDKLLLSRAAV